MASKRSAFFVSDRTAITAEMLGHSLLIQFVDAVSFNEVTLPFVDSVEKAHSAVAQINHQGALDGTTSGVQHARSLRRVLGGGISECIVSRLFRDFHPANGTGTRRACVPHRNEVIVSLPTAVDVRAQISRPLPQPPR